MSSPLRNPEGIPWCPRCKITLPDGPRYCPDCGMALAGPKLHLRTAIGWLVMLSLPLTLFLTQRGKPDRVVPPAGVAVTPQSTDVTVEPHSTW